MYARKPTLCLHVDQNARQKQQQTTLRSQDEF
jgi:hypothetical protein